MADWNAPRLNPAPPYTGVPPPLAASEADLAPLLAATKEGRFYDEEAWVTSRRPLQLNPTAPRPRERETLLGLVIGGGAYDLARLILCNGYRLDLEPTPAFDSILLRRNWDLLGFLLD